MPRSDCSRCLATGQVCYDHPTRPWDYAVRVGEGCGCWCPVSDSCACTRRYGPAEPATPTTGQEARR